MLHSCVRTTYLIATGAVGFVSMNAAFVVVSAGFMRMNAAWALTSAAFVIAIAAGCGERREGSLVARLPSAAEAEFSGLETARLKPSPFKASIVRDYLRAPDFQRASMEPAWAGWIRLRVTGHGLQIAGRKSANVFP